MRMLVALAMTAALGACVAMKAVPAGPYQVGGLGMDLQHAWTSVPPQMNMATNATMLTRHGLSLDRIDIISLKSNESFVRVPRNVDVPKFRAGMSETELVEFITASLARLGFTDVSAENVRAFTLAGSPGVRFNVAGRYSSGLNLRGDVALAESGGKLNGIVFVAPAAHYYDFSAGEIDHLMTTARAS